MPIMDKQQLITEVQMELCDKLTQKDIDIVAAALADKLARYELEREPDENEKSESEDLIRLFIEAKESAAARKEQ